VFNSCNRLYYFPVLRFLHTLSAALFTLLGFGLFLAVVLVRQELFMPWSHLLLAMVPTPLIAIGLLYGTLSIIQSAQGSHRTRAIVGTIVGAAAIALFALFAVLRVWPLT
jgi:energy-converting hydrogenase Eha subunit A